jgi:hypothetical protein
MRGRVKSAIVSKNDRTASGNNASQSPVRDWLVDNRGGTRTHDPGIMSASQLEGENLAPSENEEQPGTKEEAGSMSTGAILGASRRGDAAGNQEQFARFQAVPPRWGCLVTSIDRSSKVTSDRAGVADE